MPTIKQALDSASELSTLSDNWRLDAELLLGHVLNVSREHLFAWPEKVVSKTDVDQFEQLLARRMSGEPVAYLRGKQAFWNMELIVDNNVLIPRPETELLVEQALALIDHPTDEVCIADLGTGSGAIALALASEQPQWQIWAIDKSESALKVARKNAAALEGSSVRFLVGDWCDGLPKQYFNGIVANPPYVEKGDSHLSQGSLPFEPQMALVAENDGLADIETIIKQSAACLKPGGWLFLEHGFNQSERVLALLRSAGFAKVAAAQDLAGIPRIAFACWQGGHKG